MCSNVKREKNSLCPCNAWVVSSKCTLTAPRPELCSQSLRSDVKCGWEWEWTFFFLSFFTLGSSGRNSLPRLPGAPSLRPQALLTTWTDICWCLFPLLRQTFSHQKMMWRADTPGATLFFGAAAPRVHNNGNWIFHAALGSAGTTNAQAVLKQRFSRFVFAAKLYYVVQRWQKYSHCVLQFKCGYLCEKNTPIKVRKDRFRYRYVLN